MKTTNAGATWSQVVSGLSYAINAMYFTDVHNGVAVGGSIWSMGNGSGDILKTSDGGATWTTTTISSTLGLSSVFFPDANTGYAVGFNKAQSWLGAVVKTTDGGATWNDLPFSMHLELNSVFFTDAHTGYIAGTNSSVAAGTIIKTIDGGATWTAQASGVPSNIYSICFASDSTGVAVGVDGAILRTTNGGGLVSVQSPLAENRAFTLFPNPASTKVTITSERKLIGDVTVTIANIRGEQCLENRFHDPARMEIAVGSLTAGIYILKIRTSNGTEARKLVIQ